MGLSSLPDDVTQKLTPNNSVIGNPEPGKRTPKDVYDNGGDWLFGVHQVGNNTDNKTGYLIGFVHGEDHFYDPINWFPTRDTVRLQVNCSL